MAFNLYFAGSQEKSIDKYMQERNVHRLFSQSNEWKAIQEWTNAGYNRLFIDSGAFSVHHNGITVDIDEYINKINSNPQIPIWVELDVIPFPELNYETSVKCSDASWDNYVYMKERVNVDVELLPLYHFGEPKDGLKRILNTKVNGKLPTYIGIGGRHGVTTAEQDKYFHEVFTIIQNSDNPNVKVHAFGMTVLDLLEKYPFYSADSTSWLKFGVYGMVVTKTAGVIIVSEQSVGKKDNFMWLPEDVKLAVEEEVVSKGYTIEQLATDYKARLRFNIDYYLDWEKNYTYKGVSSFKTRRLF